MTSKNLLVLAGTAVILGGAAWYLNAGKKMRTPSVTGKRVLPAFDAAAVARIDVGGKKPLALVAGDGGWTIETLHGYPADMSKIRENLIKLQELKAGQLARGRKIAAPAKVELKDAKGKAVATLEMGETHSRKPSGQMAQFGGGGYPDGRYVKLGADVVLVKETLDAFDGDPKKWCDARIAAVPASDVQSVVFAKGKETVKLQRKDSSWTLEGLGPKEELDTSKTYSLDSALAYLDFTDVADPKLTEAELGFATGAVYTAILKNGQTYTARVGNAKGSDRWVKLSAAFKPAGTNAAENAKLEQAVKDFNARVGKWTFAVSSYSADNMSKARKDLVKAKEEPKKDEARKAESKKDAKK